MLNSNEIRKNRIKVSIFLFLLLILYLFRFIINDKEKNIIGPYFGYTDMQGNIYWNFGFSETGYIGNDMAIHIIEDTQNKLNDMKGMYRTSSD